LSRTKKTCGHVSLVSYNPAWNIAEKLQDLLKQFLEGKPPVQTHRVHDPKWWDGICEDADEFRTQYLPQNIVLLMYHVPD
jgi:hypothetical protein